MSSDEGYDDCYWDVAIVGLKWRKIIGLRLTLYVQGGPKSEATNSWP